MPTDNPNPQPNAARSRVWIAAWTIFLAIVFGYGWYNARQIEQYHLAVANWNASLERYLAHGRAEVQRLRQELDVPFGKPGSQREAERIVNRGQPFDLQKQGDLDVTNWHDPDHLVHVGMEFRDGVLVGLSISGEDGSFSQRNPAPIPLWTMPAEGWRRWFVRIAAWSWGIAGAAWIAIPRRRLLTAQIMLAAALATGTALAVHPGYSITWQGIFSNDNLFFAAIMLAISIVALALAFRRQSSKTSFRFQFGLRHALIAITILAILLAAGPFGYFTLAVGALGVLLFAAAYLFNRSLATQRRNGWQRIVTSNQNST